MLLISRRLLLDANGQGTDRQAGALLILKALSAGGTVSITWLDAEGRNAGTVNNVGIGDKLHAGGDFGGYIIQGVAGATVDLFIGPDAADAGSTLQAALTIGHVISDAGSTVTVDNVAAAGAYVRPGTGAIFSTDQKSAAALTAVAPVACTAIQAVALAADPTRRKVVFRNVGANVIALGPVGVTFANAAIVLQPTEMWNESDAPGAAWNAICDAGLASTLNIVTAA